MAVGDIRNDAADEAEELLDNVKGVISRGIRGSTPSDDTVSGTVKRVIKDLSKASVPKQIAAGATAGWLTGWVTMKVGKMAATALGGTLLVMQIAHHKGYIKVNWNKMTDDSASVADKIKDKLRLKSRSGLEKFQDFAAENAYMAGGFTGGFFMGIACS